MREKMVSRCLPYPEIEKTEESLWKTGFLFPDFFVPVALCSSPDFTLRFSKNQ